MKEVGGFGFDLGGLLHDVTSCFVVCFACVFPSVFFFFFIYSFSSSLVYGGDINRRYRVCLVSVSHLFCFQLPIHRISVAALCCSLLELWIRMAVYSAIVVPILILSRLVFANAGFHVVLCISLGLGLGRLWNEYCGRCCDSGDLELHEMELCLKMATARDAAGRIRR